MKARSVVTRGCRARDSGQRVPEESNSESGRGRSGRVAVCGIGEQPGQGCGTAAGGRSCCTLSAAAGRGRARIVRPGAFFPLSPGARCRAGLRGAGGRGGAVGAPRAEGPRLPGRPTPRAAPTRSGRGRAVRRRGPRAGARLPSRGPGAAEARGAGACGAGGQGNHGRCQSGGGRFQ